MKRIGNEQSIEPIDLVRHDGPLKFEKAQSVEVPLDFLQSISAFSSTSIERRPPRLRLTKKQTTPLIDSLPALKSDGNLGEASQISYQVADFIIRRIDQIEESNDPHALRGFAVLDRMVRMYEHVFIGGSPIILSGDS